MIARTINIPELKAQAELFSLKPIYLPFSQMMVIKESLSDTVVAKGFCAGVVMDWLGSADPDYLENVLVPPYDPEESINWSKIIMLQTCCNSYFEISNDLEAFEVLLNEVDSVTAILHLLKSSNQLSITFNVKTIDSHGAKHCIGFKGYEHEGQNYFELFDPNSGIVRIIVEHLNEEAYLYLANFIKAYCYTADRKISFVSRSEYERVINFDDPLALCLRKYQGSYSDFINNKRGLSRIDRIVRQYAMIELEPKRKRMTTIQYSLTLEFLRYFANLGSPTLEHIKHLDLLMNFLFGVAKSDKRWQNQKLVSEGVEMKISDFMKANPYAAQYLNAIRAVEKDYPTELAAKAEFAALEKGEFALFYAYVIGNVKYINLLNDMYFDKFADQALGSLINYLITSPLNKEVEQTLFRCLAKLPIFTLENRFIDPKNYYLLLKRNRFNLTKEERTTLILNRDLERDSSSLISAIRYDMDWLAEDIVENESLHNLYASTKKNNLKLAIFYHSSKVFKVFMRRLTAYDFTTAGSTGVEVLLYAAMVNHNLAASLLLTKLRTDPLQILDKNGNNALVHAIINCNKSLIIDLLKLGSKDGINHTNSEGKTPFHFAIDYSDEEIVSRMIRKSAEASLSVRDCTGFTPISRAIKFHKNKMLDAIVRLAPFEHLDYADDEGTTLLMMAAQARNYMALEMIYDKVPQATLRRKNVKGESLLYYVSDEIKKDLLDRLLEAGLKDELPSENSKFMTPVHKAILNDQIAVFKTYSKYFGPSDYHRPNSRNITWITAACLSRSERMIREIFDVALVPGVAPEVINMITTSGGSSLCAAYEAGSLSAMVRLIDAGADVSLPLRKLKGKSVFEVLNDDQKSFLARRCKKKFEGFSLRSLDFEPGLDDYEVDYEAAYDCDEEVAAKRVCISG